MGTVYVNVNVNVSMKKQKNIMKYVYAVIVNITDTVRLIVNFHVFLLNVETIYTVIKNDLSVFYSVIMVCV